MDFRGKRHDLRLKVVQKIFSVNGVKISPNLRRSKLAVKVTFENPGPNLLLFFLW